MKVDLREQSFENIRIKDTSLVGGNFVRCNFNGSEFDNVDISGMNLNQAQLFNRKWKNIKIHELNKLDGHSDYVRSDNFSPDGTTLASGSQDYSIRLWDVKTGQQKAKLDGHSREFYQSISLLMLLHQLLVVQITLSVYGMQKHQRRYYKSDSSYKDLLTQFKLPLQNSSLLPNFNPDRTILRICQNPLFEASGKLILQGQFKNHLRKDLNICFNPKEVVFQKNSSKSELEIFINYNKIIILINFIGFLRTCFFCFNS
ncbi:unnamed protein product (macronuclear) [Paramecium tetraurelia]|uniref:Uncharacterized protein n=1 Tax=Paramecium tetraurelia TaxID=5888 RepID=A0DNB7_PARTE|nr:uncharacterized protein GSPATT00039693001 [Paramecium tetraurelia]CAK84534.1 unnamed protein product [Paramecium tetraurelia]|eukprot:XP_001451931.1 hypothetical protein (macronuclear) [Paramecium tetraurelia strain d4-2]